MRTLTRVFWGGLTLLIVLWLVTEPGIFQLDTIFALRDPMIQLTGIIAIASMSLAMLLALRPRWPEAWFDGLDKMYRLHKWLGITALVASLAHWLWIEGPKWATVWG
jgi:predicted ferric reductase